MLEDLIRQVPLFAHLPPEEIHHLARVLRPIAFPAGALLFREDEYGDRFYVLLEGQVEILKALDTPTPRRLSVRGPGDYIGEMSLLQQAGRRTASARASTAVSLLEMTRADFDELLARHPSLAYDMVRVLSQRLAAAQNEALQDLQAKNRELSEAYRALQTAQAQIVEKEKLEHELRMAREVQASLLPRQLPHLPGWELAAAWQPAREVSGDFYDLLALPGETPRWGVVLADVSGKGMPAALFMALARNTVRASMIGLSLRPPAECMAKANRLLYADAHQGMFVTLVYAQFDPETGDLIYVNAGHNPPWLYRAATNTWSELARTGPALGLWDGVLFTQTALRLEAGDLIVFYTDGLTDAINPAGNRLEAPALQAAAATSPRTSAAALVADLETVVAEFRAGQPLYDDITLVVLKRRLPPAEAAPVTSSQ